MFFGFGSDITRGMILIFGTYSLLFSFMYIGFTATILTYDFEPESINYYAYIVFAINGFTGGIYLLQGVLSFIRKDRNRKIISKTVFLSLIISILYLAYYMLIPNIYSGYDFNSTILLIIVNFVFWRIFNDKKAINYFNKTT